MIGIIVQLALSWLLLYFIQRRHLSVLGFRPTPYRLKYSGLGLLLTIAFFSLFFIGQSFLDKNFFQLNPTLTAKSLLTQLWQVTKSVIFEELLFRGALLYILIQRIGPKWAVLLSAIAFGIYHWFSYGVFGSPVAMGYVFLGTGLAGLAFAQAFKKTGSMLLPFALHFGTNFTRMILFAQNPGDKQCIFIRSLERYPEIPGSSSTVIGLLVLLLFFGYPLLTLLWLRYIPREMPISAPAAAPANSTHSDQTPSLSD